MRDLASNLNTNVDRLVPSREDIEKQQAMVQQQQAMMQQAALAQSQNLQEDGTQQGGRDSNFVSARPNGV
jgi:hypothetical protein